jgi:hypothetical protein
VATREDVAPGRGAAEPGRAQHFPRLNAGGSADMWTDDSHMARGASSITSTRL